LDTEQKITNAKKLILDITLRTWLVDFYIQERKEFEYKKWEFIITDLDDTLYSRDKILENEKLLRENRGADWNTVLVNQIWIHNFIEKYYTKAIIPSEILSQLTCENSLILTAGLKEQQLLKIRGLDLEHIPHVVVDAGADKILETIRHVIFTLWYIPTTIKVYEDRPQFFIKYKELIETCLWTTLEIYYVEMNGNSWYKKIELTG